MSYLETALRAVKQDQQPDERQKIRLVKKPQSSIFEEILGKNQHPKGTPEARQESLEETMAAILLDARNRIIETYKGRQYKPTDEIRQAENNIDDLYRQTKEGKASIAEFRAAVNQWETLISFG